jgi:hypothetical protein
MKGQKQAVVEAVQRMLPNFNLYKDIALVMLTSNQLESLKHEIGHGIYMNQIEYSKDLTNGPEVFAYARSMVMNHLKKAKELNGNQIYGVGPVVVQSKPPKALADIDMDLLSDDLKAFVNTLV